MDVMIIAGNARSLVANRGDLIREMIAQGLEVGAAVPTADYLSDVETLGISIFPIDMGRTGVNPVHDLKTLHELYKLIRKIKPCVVFSYTSKPVIYGSLAAKMAGVPRIYSMITGLGHLFTTDTPRTRRLRRVLSMLYRAGLSCNDRVFFQNPDDLQEFTDRRILNKASKAVRTYGSGVDMQRFARQPLPQGPLTFLFIGRLLGEKGIAEFCEAANILKQHYPNVRFIAVGPHDPKLPHACDSQELERWQQQGAVEFIGGVDDVRPWICQCSVFVLPSYREGTPRSVLEAMSMGRAIITSDAPGCRETVEHGVNGYLVAPRVSAPLADAMESFIHEPEKAAVMGAASLALVEKYYDVRKVNRVIMEAMLLTEPVERRAVEQECT